MTSLMDPVTGRLVVHDDGNSMLEPFRRVADSAIPTKPDEFVGHPPFKATSYQKDPEPIETVLKASNDAIAMWSKQYPSQVTINSPDNPLLGLSEAEYLAMKRYQQEHAVPDRFKLNSVATRNSAFQTKEPPPANPVYNTSYQEYGKYQPNEHSQPQSYHGLRTKFSYKKYQQGMYRNHSLNV